MVSLTAGIALTLLSWIGLMVAVIHGKYVTEKIKVGEYYKGPFERRAESGADDTSNGGDRA